MINNSSVQGDCGGKKKMIYHTIFCTFFCNEMKSRQTAKSLWLSKMIDYVHYRGCAIKYQDTERFDSYI